MPHKSAGSKEGTSGNGDTENPDYKPSMDGKSGRRISEETHKTIEFRIINFSLFSLTREN